MRFLTPLLAVVRVRGDLDRPLALEVQRQVDEAARHGHLRVVVDLREAGAVEPDAPAALLDARRRLLSIGGELTVVAEEDVLGADGLLPSVPTLAAAGWARPYGATRPALVGEVAPLRRAVTRWAEEAGASARTLDAVALATSEAITNAVVHAYRDAPRHGQVTVSGEVVGDERLRVTVTDRGAGMNPRADSPGLGLGLPLIVQLAENVEIDSRVDEGTRIAMDFAVSGC